MKKILIMFLLCFVIFGCETKEKKLLRIYNWSYFINPEVIKDFEKEYNARVEYTVFNSNEEMYTNIKAGTVECDVTFPSSDYASIMIKEDMLAKIDKKKIPNIKYILKSIMDKVTFDLKSKYSIPYMAGCSGIAVNKKYVKEYEKNYSIFEREDLKGKITLLNDSREVIGAALKSLGYSVNTINKKELAEARNLIFKWKDNSAGFDSENFAQKFSKEKIWVAHCYAENIFGELTKEERENTDFFIPKSGGAMYIDNMVILKDSKNKKLAHQFINFIHKPEEYAKIVDYLGYPSINTEAKKLRKTKPNYYLEELKQCELREEVGNASILYDMVWQEIIMSK